MLLSIFFIITFSVILGLLNLANWFMGKGLKSWHVDFSSTAQNSEFDLAYFSTSKPSENDSEKIGILFIHGTPGSAQNFYKQFENPINNTVYVTYNRPGFWDSSASIPIDTVASQAKAAELVMGKYEISQWILVGHSYGGPVALKVALSKPELVVGVIQVGGALDPSLEKIHPIQHVGNLGIIKWLVPRSLRSSNSELIQLKADLEALKDDMIQLKTPIVMLHGTEDKLVPVENCQYIKSELSKVQLDHLLHLNIHEGWNHFIPWEHPDEVTKSIQILIENKKNAPTN